MPTGAFIACARLLHAVRRISRPKRVLWVCFGATFALLNRLQQQRSGSAAQQVSSTDHPTPGKLRKAIPLHLLLGPPVRSSIRPRADTSQASAPSAPHRRRRHHGPPDPCARAGAGDRRCVVHIPQRKVLHRLLSRIRTSPPRRRDRAAFPSPPGALVRCMAPSRGRTSVAPLGRARKAGGRISGAPALHQFDGFD